MAAVWLRLRRRIVAAAAAAAQSRIDTKVQTTQQRIDATHLCADAAARSVHAATQACVHERTRIHLRRVFSAKRAVCPTVETRYYSID